MSGPEDAGQDRGSTCAQRHTRIFAHSARQGARVAVAEEKGEETAGPVLVTVEELGAEVMDGRRELIMERFADGLRRDRGRGVRGRLVDDCRWWWLLLMDLMMLAVQHVVLHKLHESVASLDHIMTHGDFLR